MRSAECGLTEIETAEYAKHAEGRRSQQDFYEAHDRPKQLWVRELREGARTILRGRKFAGGLPSL